VGVWWCGGCGGVGVCGGCGWCGWCGGCGGVGVWGCGGVGVVSPLRSNIPRSALCVTLDTYNFLESNVI
jgi:hypothetical protein